MPSARPPTAREVEPFAPGATVHVRDGGVVFALVPLHLDAPGLS